MTRLQQLFEEQGQSPWLDNLKRGYLTGGDLERLVNDGIRGVTSNPAIRGARAIAAAKAKREAAAPEAAYELLAIAEMTPLSELQQAEIARMRAQMEFVRSRSGMPGALRTSDAATLLHSAATGLEGLDDGLARETHFEALTAARYAGRLDESGAMLKVAKAGRAAVDRLDELRRPIDFLLSGIDALLAEIERPTSAVREAN